MSRCIRLLRGYRGPFCRRLLRWSLVCVSNPSHSFVVVEEEGELGRGRVGEGEGEGGEETYSSQLQQC